MAVKKVGHRLTVELAAGDAAVVDLGKMLGPTGVNMMAVKRAYDEATAGQRGDIVPVVITIYDDKSFELRYKTPPTASLIKQALATNGSSGDRVLSRAQLETIAARKLPDLNTADLAKAARTVAGTARSMGVRVEEG
ncbi:MAG: 50S ribosomal protein L11 [Streptosporangiales bacterium]|nr:50S ribosomal protein L11 [Streptosporangiales bacterium]